MRRMAEQRRMDARSVKERLDRNSQMREQYFEKNQMELLNDKGHVAHVADTLRLSAQAGARRTMRTHAVYMQDNERIAAHLQRYLDGDVKRWKVDARPGEAADAMALGAGCGGVLYRDQSPNFSK